MQEIAITTLYTHGQLTRLTPTQFNSYSLIRDSADHPNRPVSLGLTASGTVDFAAKLGTVSADVYGWTGNDAITTGSGNDSLWGNGGDDTLSGGAGSDLLVGDWDTADRVGNDILYGGDGNDELIGGSGNDILQGGDGDDVFSYGELVAGRDSLFGGAGVDAVSVRDFFGTGLRAVSFNRLVLTAAASVEFFAWDDSTVALRGTAGDDLIDLSGTKALTWNVGTYDERITFDLGTGHDSFFGGTSAETIVLNLGGDTVSLGEGDDRLVLVGGDLSDSTIRGGAGQDTLVLRGTSATPLIITTSSLNLTEQTGFEALIFENARFRGTSAADRFDLSGIVQTQGSGISFDMGRGADYFMAAAIGSNVNGQGGRDTLLGGSGDDWLRGGTGVDSLAGGQGNDVYQVDSRDDVTIERADEGFDTIQTSLARFTLGETFEGLTALGNLGLYGIGNAANNAMASGGGADHLFGLGGADTLTGGDGADTLDGGLDNDTYFVTTDDVIVEGEGASFDIAYARTGLYTLALNVEVLRAQGNLALDGTGNIQANTIYGSDLNDTLHGLGGNDTLIGGRGDDQLEGGWGNDSLDGGTGNDSLLGGAGADLLYGGEGNDVLDSGGGVDFLYGANGDDRYVVHDAEEVIVEYQTGGIDTVVSYVSEFHLAIYLENIEAGASMRGVTLYGNYDDNILKGSSGKDQLYGEGGNDTLYSSGGNDTLYGGTGADSYYLDATSGMAKIVEANDPVFEFDTVYSAAALTILTSNVDALHITSTAGATARAESTTVSWLFGGIGDDRLEFGTFMDGGLGADTMIGATGGGSTFVVDDLGDVLGLTAGGIAETVKLKLASYQMDDLLENLVVIGRGAHVTGSDFANGISGGVGRDTLDGMGGDDTLNGGDGRDLLRGGDGNDTLYWGAGDTLNGGAGDDTYKTFTEDCTIVEKAGGGFDTVDLSLYVTNFTLPDNVEGLIFNGYMGDCTGFGNDLDNLISGSSSHLYAYGLGGNDTLVGSRTWSHLFGGAGDDQYVMRGSGAIIEEAADEGFDTVFTNSSFHLPQNVEGLTMLEGATGFAEGNELDNVLTGNSGGNFLSGGFGNDTLTGGGGNDTFRIDEPGWVDHITDFEGGNHDQILLTSGFPALTTGLDGWQLSGDQFKDLSTGAEDSSDRILYDRTTGEMFYDADGAGGADAILFLVIENKVLLETTDFWIN